MGSNVISDALTTWRVDVNMKPVIMFLREEQGWQQVLPTFSPRSPDICEKTDISQHRWKTETVNDLMMSFTIVCESSHKNKTTGYRDMRVCGRERRGVNGRKCESVLTLMSWNQEHLFLACVRVCFQPSGSNTHHLQLLRYLWTSGTQRPHVMGNTRGRWPLTRARGVQAQRDGH